MAKGNRKRVEQKIKKIEEAPDRAKVQLINQQDAYEFQSLVEISNNYGKLMQQHEQYGVIKKTLKERRIKVQTGEIKLPIQVQLSQNMFYAEDDKKEVLKILDEQIKIVSNSLKGIEQQVTNTRDAYVEAGLRIKTFSEKRFGIFTAKTMDLRSVNPSKKENKMFEADYKDMLKDPKLMKQFEEAQKQAAKENEALLKKKAK